MLMSMFVSLSASTSAPVSGSVSASRSASARMSEFVSITGSFILDYRRKALKYLCLCLSLCLLQEVYYG